ncbi:MAG: protein kinase [Myxococcota bacterium]|nr:protein kinase [Myxococcota bacterium]
MDSPEESSPARVHCRHCGELHPTTFSHCPRTGRSLTSGRALVGRVIANRYRVLALLGEGGMGAVYVAEHLLIGRKVALKRLHPELTGDEKAVARFQREARAAAATGHEHIVEVLDLGFGEDGAPFLVMEYLRGKALSRLLAEHERLEPRRACRIVGQVLAALHAVHRRGIVHRDLKPDNIFLTRRRGDTDFVKVVDFGISKMRTEEGEQGMDLTRTGVMLGTPFYMSPEQARGVKNLDHRIDLFGAGVILYESLAGQLPFDGENYHQLLQAILSGKHPPVLELRPDLPPALAEVVEKAIAQSPDDRYQSAREMLLALVPHGAIDAGPPLESEPPPPAPSFPSMAQTTPFQPGASSDPAPRARVTPLAEAQGAATLRSTTPFGAGAALAPTRPSPPEVTPEPRRAVDGSRPRGLALAPRPPSGPGRRFVAQSVDWEGVSETVRSSGLRERGALYAAQFEAQAEAPRFGARPEARHEPRPEPRATPAGHTRVKGSLVLAATEHLRSLDEPGFERVRSRLDDDVAARIAGVMLPMAWIELGDYAELLRAGERELGAGDGSLSIQIGRATADRELTTTHRLFMQTATPTMAVERIPQLFRTYHSAGRAEVERASAGGFKVTMQDVLPDTLTHAMALSGFWQRLLELTGGRDVKSSVIACRERGDDATITVLRWR